MFPVVPVMIDLMRFLGGASGDAMIAVLEELTGQEFGGDWNQWMDMEVARAELLGLHASRRLPGLEGGAVLDDPSRFANFLRDGETARIDLAEVTWGGVVPEHPGPQDPKTLTVAEAEYMNPDDRVFGRLHQREQRAYPLASSTLMRWPTTSWG